MISEGGTGNENDKSMHESVRMVSKLVKLQTQLLENQVEQAELSARLVSIQVTLQIIWFEVCQVKIIALVRATVVLGPVMQPPDEKLETEEHPAGR